MVFACGLKVQPDFFSKSWKMLSSGFGAADSIMTMDHLGGRACAEMQLQGYHTRAG